MPITNDPENVAAQQSAGVGQPSLKQSQEGANALEAAAPEQDELADLDLSGAETVGPVPFSGFDNDEDELLFGPTDRPDQLMSHIRPTGRVRIPQGLEQKLPALLEAARQPGAPQELHNFIRMLAYELGQEY